VGNRLTENDTGVITYSYDANNKLTQLVGPSGTTTFGYDNNGNTTSMTQPGPLTTTYGYNYENRMTGVANPSYTANYTYSADGLRLRVQESNNPNPDRWMQYDGVRPVLEGTLNGDTYTTTAKYVWEGNSYYSPLLYSMLGGTWRYHLYDGLGSTRQLLQHLSPYNVTDTYDYEAFGNLLSSTGSTPNPYRYVGSLGYYQTGSSLMHLGARYYMPEVGRFAHSAFYPSALRDSQYVYGRSNPARYVDPQGFKEKQITGAELCRKLCDIALKDPVTNKACKAGCKLIEEWENCLGKIATADDLCLKAPPDKIPPQLTPRQWCGQFCVNKTRCYECCARLVGDPEDDWPIYEACMEKCDTKKKP
jgi:RHS repeat-associated protein